MKIIHAADLHLGSKFLKIEDVDKQKELIAALNNSFKNMIDYANINDIKIVLLSGDIFDKDKVIKKDKEYFYSIIKNNPQIDFYYIKGNHDIKVDYEEELDNLYWANNTILKPYIIDNKIAISGLEITNDNKNDLYDMIPLSKSFYNITLLHGDIYKKEGDYSIDLDKLKGKNINYLALGHIHQKEIKALELNSIYAYPGSLFGRGFDEINDKGFLVLNTDDSSVLFIKNDSFFFDRKEFDVSKFNSLYELIDYIEKNTEPNEKKLLQIVLKNRLNFSLDTALIYDSLNKLVYFLDIKNKTKKSLSETDNFNPQTLKYTFVNMIKEDDSLDLDTKEEIISYGLSKILRKE